MIPTSRGAIKKILLAPGRNTQLLLVMFNDGVEIWDCAESEVSVLGTVNRILRSLRFGRSQILLLYIGTRECISVDKCNFSPISYLNF